VDRFAIQDYDTAYELLAEFNEKGDPESEKQLYCAPEIGPPKWGSFVRPITAIAA
jgi:hypothetical protein